MVHYKAGQYPFSLSICDHFWPTLFALSTTWRLQHQNLLEERRTTTKNSTPQEIKPESGLEALSAGTEMSNFESIASAGGALPEMNALPSTTADPATLYRTILQVDVYDDALSILGLYYHTKVTEKDINLAFRKIALILHPDKCIDASQAELYTRLFQKLETAKESLLSGAEVSDIEPQPLLLNEGPESRRIRVFDAREKLKAARAQAVQNKALSPKLKCKAARSKLEREVEVASVQADVLRKRGQNLQAAKVLSAAKDKLAEFNARYENAHGVFDDPGLAESRWEKNLRRGKTSATTGVSFELKKQKEQQQMAQDLKEMCKIDSSPEEAAKTVQQRWLKEDREGWTRKVFDANGQSWYRCAADMEADMSQSEMEARWVEADGAWKKILYWKNQ
ncbi:hypothetical protein BST61_g3402 [Cercospora zeina]